ncbi:hypothetical protein KIPB_001667 [Kipferlia bialata]|uniref:Uncharacterized protein n=1 Tax=Kipferlia bialata TaxID=797122 RepID=A0A391NIV9_9EUKA|nr:hypothetical protein KIPB_001667 [Kipferlia bialata]|eukprot:g1667.t1
MDNPKGVGVTRALEEMQDHVTHLTHSLERERTEMRRGEREQEDTTRECVRLRSLLAKADAELEVQRRRELAFRERGKYL